MTATIILQGITLDEFQAMLKETVRGEITAIDNEKAHPLTKVEACDKLGITYKTLVKAMERTGLSEVYPSDLDRLRLKCPELFRRAKINY